MIRKIASIVNIALLTLAVYLGVSFFYKVAGAKLDTAFPANYTRVTQDSPRGADAGRPLREYAVIAQRNIFKAKEKTDEQSLTG